MAGGQFFNLFNLGKTPEAMKDLQTKELKNGAHRWISVFCNRNLQNMGRAYLKGALCFSVADLDFVGECQGAWRCSRSSVCPYIYDFKLNLYALLACFAPSCTISCPHLHNFDQGMEWTVLTACCVCCPGYGAQAVMTHEGPFKVKCPSQTVCEVCAYSQHVMFSGSPLCMTVCITCA